jgi:hypothetical protein
MDKRKNNMKDKNEIRLAYTVWTLIAKLNDLLWDHYEDDFIQYQKEEVIYSGNLTDHLDNDDF